MITLYHAPRSRSSRIIWLLEELAVPYEICPVSIFRPMTGEGQGDPANPHPDRRVPAIVHDGTLVTESVAIVSYLVETFPQARLAPEPGDRRRGEFLTWMAWYGTELEPVLFAGMAGALAGSPMKQRDHDAVIARLEAALAAGPYVMGETFTGADILIGSALGYGRAVFAGNEIIAAYVERCQNRPAFARALALDDQAGLQNTVSR